MKLISRIFLFTFLTVLILSCNMGGNEGRNVESLIQRLDRASNSQKDSIFQALDRSMLLQKDLPTLYAGIRLNYPDDSLRERSSKARLIGLLESVNDESTPAFLKEQFMLWETNYFMKRTALQTLCNINTEGSLAAFIELLLLDPKNMAAYADHFFTPIITEPAHSSVLFPAALALVEKSSYCFPVLECLRVGLEEGDILPEVIKDDLLPIREVYRAQRKRRDRYAPGSRSYMLANTLMATSMKCLSYFPAESSTQQVIALASEDNDIEVRLFALLIRLHGDTTGCRQDLHELAGDFRYRNRLYEVLKEAELEQHFPAEFLTQQAFAEGDLAGWLKMPEHRASYPEGISLIRRFSHQTADDQQESNFYLFKFTYGKGWQIGLSGPQPLDTTDFAIAGYMTGSKYLAEDAREEDGHVAELIEED